MSDPEKAEKQNACRWLDPSDESLPPFAAPPPQNNRNESTRAPNALHSIQTRAMTGLLTIPEKEHWKNRIEKRIDQHMEAIYAREPLFLERLQHESRQRALASLGLLEWQTELDAIEQQRITLEQRKRQIERSMLAQVRGVPTEDIDDYETYRDHRKVIQAVERRQAVHHDELLGESDIGQRILNLRKAKENLLDAVWLVTSLEQLRELWSKVTEILNDEPTLLGLEILAIITQEG